MAGKTVITFGTFDVFHVGHVQMLNRSAALGNRLVVGVSSDNLNFAKKGRNPVFSQENGSRSLPMSRLSMRCSSRKASSRSVTTYVVEHNADILVMGDDWKGKFDFLNDICEVVYLPRTPSVSTTTSSSRSSAIPDQYGGCTGEGGGPPV